MMEVKDLTFTYPGEGQAPALDRLSVTIPRAAFALLCGASGSGKSTLLRHMKHELVPHGKRSGGVFWRGQPLESLSLGTSAKEIGFVFQDPENQLVTSTVRHELAFGLENLGVPGEEIRRRVAETALFFGIDRWIDRETEHLSGGEKQILSLAAVMTMNPRLLLLDEPTAQLDPVAAKNLLVLLGRINSELGVTVVVSEHRLEELLPICHQVLLLQKGRLEYAGFPREFSRYIMGSPGHPFASALASASRIAAKVEEGSHPVGGEEQACPISVREGSLWARTWLNGRVPGPLPAGEPPSPGSVALEAKDLWYRYRREDDFVLRGLSFSLEAGTIHGVLGGNGSGKTTLLRLLAGVDAPYQGRVILRDKRRTGMLSQFPRAMFTKDTMGEELAADLPADPAAAQEIKALVGRFGLDGQMDRHPYDLSVGEQQKAALAKVLLRHPDILLLDEPTKGLDAFAKEELARLLEEQRREGKTILLVTHDVEFAAQYCHKCSLLFGGMVVCTQGVEAFFQENHFFTTAACRITRGLGGAPAVTCSSAAASLLASGRGDAPETSRSATPPRTN